MAKDSEKEYHDLQQAERILTDYYDTRFTLGDVAAPKAATPKRPSTTFFGGILNNRNDPKRSKTHEFKPKTRKLVSSGTAFREIKSLELEFSPLFTRNASYRLPQSSFPKPKIDTPKVKPASPTQPINADFFQTSGLRINPSLLRIPTKRKFPRSKRPELVSKSVSTEGLKDPFPSLSTKSGTGYCLSPNRGSSPAARYIDQVVQFQAYRKYVRRCKGKTPVGKIRSPKTRPFYSQEWKLNSANLTVLGEKKKD